MVYQLSECSPHSAHEGLLYDFPCSRPPPVAMVRILLAAIVLFLFMSSYTLTTPCLTISTLFFFFPPLPAVSLGHSVGDPMRVSFILIS